MIDFIFVILLVFVDVELSVSRNGTDGVLLAVAAKGLRAVGILAAATKAELLHHGVDVRLENLGELKRKKRNSTFRNRTRSQTRTYF